MPRANYFELPSPDLAAARDFYADAFGWQATPYGPTYAATASGDVDIGLQGDANEATRAPLVVIEVDDAEAMQATVHAAGGRIVRPLFAYPGGRRFHFLDPNGNELAVSQPG